MKKYKDDTIIQFNATFLSCAHVYLSKSSDEQIPFALRINGKLFDNIEIKINKKIANKMKFIYTNDVIKDGEQTKLKISEYNSWDNSFWTDIWTFELTLKLPYKK